MKDITLKPCPFCGKQPTTWFDGGDSGEGYNIDCCCVSVYSVGKNDAIRKWNTRYETEGMPLKLKEVLT